VSIASGIRCRRLLKPLAYHTAQPAGDVKAAAGGAPADAIRHGIARALCLVDESCRAPSRPPVTSPATRAKERKKYSLKAARRAPQFSKR